MLDGVTPFPAEFAARYRELGYWEDRPLFDGFTAVLAAYADRVAVVDETGPVTYGQLGERSERLARALLDVGLRPLDRVIVQLPNTAVFVYLYFALQQIGAVPVLALPGHRKREISQFAEISAATALAVPAWARGFDFAAMAADVMTDRPDLRLCLVQGLTIRRTTRASCAWKTCLLANRGPAARRWSRSASTRPTRRCSCSPGARPGFPS
jgi:non-ribosomal peptide synthetase component E (peptide arylation enzyme)